MKVKRIPYVALIAFLAVSLLMTTVAVAGPAVLPTNHYMAANLRMITEDTSATEATVGKITGPVGVPIVFRTFDQLTCNAGQYEIVMRIVKIDTNTIVATTKPIAVAAPHDGYVHSQPAVWQVLFPAVGWYRFEVVANGTPIAFYYFVAAFNL